MRFSRKTLLLLICCQMMTGTCDALAGRLNLLGGLNFTAFTRTPVATDFRSTAVAYERKLGHGGGLELGFSLGSSAELALGAILMQRHFGTSPTPVFKHTTIEVPILLRYFLDSVVAIQAGGYLSKGSGWVTLIDESAATNTPDWSTQMSFGDSGFNLFDYGAVLGLSVTTATASRLAFDLRYLIGMNNGSQNPQYKGSISAIEILLSVAAFGSRR